MCDALSTAVFIGGTVYADRLYQANGNFEYIILSDDSGMYVSNGLEGRLELSEKYKD